MGGVRNGKVDKVEPIEIPDFDYDEALEELKETAFGDRSLLGLSKEALKMVAAWPNVRRWRVKDPMGDKRLHITWHYINWEMTEWAILANIHDEVAWSCFYKLARQNIVYPDGTYPDQVADYLKQEVDDLLGRGEEE
jgi:hypothetical protein